MRISTVMETRQSGFTVVELMVSITVIGVLMSLLLPAVQQVRATARRVKCKNHLHQIGVATHNFIDVEKRLPGTLTSLDELLPYLDQKPLHDALHGVGELSRNRLQTPGVYLCPSDPNSSLDKMRMNYLINDGTSLKFQNPNGMRVNLGLKPTLLRDITDGLSNTAMFSERAIRPPGTLSDAFGKLNPLSSVWHLSRDYGSGQEEEFSKACSDMSQHTTTLPALSLGLNLLGVSHHTKYNHFVTPNRPGCYSTYHGTILGAAEPATSFHHGGVNILLCDGSVRFVSETIDRSVWQAIGTRNGNEPVPNF